MDPVTVTSIIGHIAVFFSICLFVSTFYYRREDTGAFFAQSFNIGLCMFGLGLPILFLCFRLGIYIRDQTMMQSEYAIIIPILGFVLPTLLIGWTFHKKTNELVKNEDLI